MLDTAKDNKVIKPENIDASTTTGPLAETLAGHEIVYLIQTSGTSGPAKPVLVPEAALLPNLRDIRREFELSPTDTVLLASPLTFDPSLVDVLCSLVAGARLLVLPASLKIKTDLHRDAAIKRFFV